MNEKDFKRFMSKVQKDPGDNGCWFWTGTYRPNGYGMMKVNGKYVSAHRLSYEHFVGPLKENCLHKCNHRWCVNPNHLKDGPQWENMIDCHNIGKFTTRKLTEEDAKEIKIRLLTQTMQSVADRFGVALSSIQNIKEGRSYKRITI